MINLTKFIHKGSFILITALMFMVVSPWFNKVYARSVIGAITVVQPINNHQITVGGWLCFQINHDYDNGSEVWKDMAQFQMDIYTIEDKINEDTNDPPKTYRTSVWGDQNLHTLARTYSGIGAGWDCRDDNHAFVTTVNIDDGRSFGRFMGIYNGAARNSPGDATSGTKYIPGPEGVFLLDGSVKNSLSSSQVVYPNNPNDTGTFRDLLGGGGACGSDETRSKIVNWGSIRWGGQSLTFPGYNHTSYCWNHDLGGGNYGHDSVADATTPIGSGGISSAGQTFKPSGGAGSSFYSSTAKYLVTGIASDTRGAPSGSVGPTQPTGVTYKLFASGGRQLGNQVDTNINGLGDHPMTNNTWLTLNGSHFASFAANSPYWFSADDLAYIQIETSWGSPWQQEYDARHVEGNTDIYPSGQVYINASSPDGNSDLANTTILADKIDSSCDSISVPETVNPGQSFSAVVTLVNTGTKTWKSSDNFRLGSQNPQDNLTWGGGRVALPANVAPGARAVFSFTAVAPTTPNTYNFSWKMVKEGEAWFGTVCTSTIRVSYRPPTISSISVDGDTGGITYGLSGLLTTEGGSNFYNPLYITLNATAGSGTLHVEAVAFYDKKEGTSMVQTSFTTLDNIKTFLNNHSSDGFLLGYTPGQYFFYSSSERNWHEFTSPANIQDNSGNIIATVDRGVDAHNNLVAAKWKVTLQASFGTKDMYTASYADDSNSQRVFKTDCSLEESTKTCR